MLGNHARGIDERKVEPPGEAKSISRETTFGEDSRNQLFLVATLRYLAERVGSRLRRQGKRARCVTLKLRYADFTTITRQQTLAQAGDTDETIFATGARLLKRELAGSKLAVRLIGIGVSGLTQGKQLSMLDTAETRLEQLDAAVDRIRNKYGFGAIQTGRTLLLKDIFAAGKDGYNLPTPSLSQ
jgi:DNA polymerase-4